MPRVILSKDTKDLTNLTTDLPEQVIQVQKYDDKDDKGGKQIRYYLTVLAWNEKDQHYDCTHRLDCKKFNLEDNTSEGYYKDQE